MNLSRIFSKRRISLYLLIALLTAFCFALLVYRINLTGRMTYSFLTWNLFLGFIPFGMSTLLVNSGKLFKKTPLQLLLFGIWLLFLPNAFYIITDLFHLRPKQQIPLWYDLLLIFSFALNGLIAGYISLLDVHNWIEQNLGRVWSWSLSVSVIVLSAFGVYIGRYLRWNSWDIIADPWALFEDILDRIIHPKVHSGAWGMTLLYSAFFLIIFLFLRLLTNHPSTLKNLEHEST